MPYKPISAEDYELHLEGEQRAMVAQLRQLILAAVPGVMEAIKWDIPYYSYKGHLCYINARKQEVDVGFLRGNDLADPAGLLATRGKLVRHVKFYSPEELREKASAFLELLQEATLLNEQQPNKKMAVARKKH